MFNFRRDMHNKFNDQSFINMLKILLRNLLKFDDNFCKKRLTKGGLKILKKSMHVKGTEK